MGGWLVPILINMAIATGITLIAAHLTKKEPEDQYAQAQKFDKPVTEEGLFYPIVFGLGWIEAPILCWWGDQVAIPNIAREDGVYYTASHTFAVGSHLKLTQGMNDGVIAIRCGDYHAWPDPENVDQWEDDGETTIVIDQRQAFGGTLQGGGIYGQIDIQYGDPAQTINSYLYALQGANVSANRGFTAAILRRVECGTSPNIPPWKFLLKRVNKLSTDGSQNWYPSKAAINMNRINPAHLLRECFTDTEWGYRKSPSLIDDTSWEAAADLFYDEGFGLAMKWEGEQTLEDFVKNVLRHIDARIYENHSTGKIMIKPIRDDYNPDNLETFDKNDIKSISGFSRDMPNKVPNMTYLTYTDIVHNKDVSIKYTDSALINLQNGREISNNVQFRGVVDDDLAARLIVREQNLFSLCPAYMKIKAKRTMAHLLPGDVFKLNYKVCDVTITGMIIRILDIDYGALEDGYIELDCMEDIFGLPNAQFAYPPSSYWKNPVYDAEDVTDYELEEAPYLTLVKHFGQTEVGLLDDDAGFLMAAAARPTPDSIKYELLIRSSPTASFVPDENGNFCPNGTLSSAIERNAQDATLTLNDAESLSTVSLGSYAIIGDTELVKVLSVNAASSQVQVARGVLDTVPAAHSSGARIFFIESVLYLANPEYTATDQPGVKFLTETAKDKLTESDATARNADTMNSRMIRPYPPGNFKINSVSYPKCFTGEPTLTWAHRDRTQQIEQIIEHDNSNIGPEAGTTYTLKIYDEDDVLARTESSLTGTSYTYTEANEIADCGEIQVRLRFELYAVRDGYESWQKYVIQLPRTVAPSPASAVAGKADPTVVLGSLSISPTAASAVGAKVDPTVIIS